MRVAIVSNWYPPYALGGAEILAHAEAVALRDRGHCVMAFVGDGRPDAVRYRLAFDELDGIPVWRVGLEPGDFSFGNVNFHHSAVERHFARFLGAFRPDAVHFHNLSGLSLGVIGAAARCGVHTVVTLHDYWGFCFKNTLLYVDGSVCSDPSRCLSCAARILDDAGGEYPIRLRNDYIAFQFSKADLFLSPSAALAERYRATGVTRDRLSVVANGVDTKRFAAVASTPVPGILRVTYAGYLGPHKGVDVLIDAVSQLASRDGLQVRIIGDGWYRQKLCERIASERLEQTVRILPSVPHDRMEDVYRETDVFVLPSIWPENQPCTIMEAMACGVPVIASEFGGTRELITPGREGLLFRPADATGLERAIQLFQDQPWLVGQMGRAARMRAESYPFDSYISTLEKMLDPAPPAQTSRPQRVIACLGGRFPECFHGVPERFGVQNSPNRVLFVMDGWLTDEERHRMDACWVLETGTSVTAYMTYLESGIPLLLPDRLPSFVPDEFSSRCHTYKSVSDLDSLLSTILDDGRQTHFPGPVFQA